MEWIDLLSAERFEPDGASTSPTKIDPVTYNPSPYENDAQRILSCTAFRRLQGKTQVYPFPSKDFMRTRLTHTIEVANTAHVIGDMVGRLVLDREPYLKETIRTVDKKPFIAADFADICAAAAYAHDLGNPPFGHIGEFAIQSWFHRHFQPPNGNEPTKQTFARGSHFRDFKNFDGNAQGFRILTRLQGWRNEGGLQLSAATIGAFSKYPWSARYSPPNKAKFGFATDDSVNARKIFGKLLNLRTMEDKRLSICYARHPLAYITEAADDICYLTTDIEDGVKQKLVSFSDVEELFLTLAQRERFARRYNQIRHKDIEDKIKFLRAAAVCSLRYQALHAFEENYDTIVRGDMAGTLLDNCELSKECEDIRRICREKIYVDRNKMEIEAAGYTIIQKLLDFFYPMIDRVITRGVDFDSDKRLHNAYQLLPKEDQFRLRTRDPYRSYLVLTDFISGMTDRYALELYQKINGTSVSLGRML